MTVRYAVPAVMAEKVAAKTPSGAGRPAVIASVAASEEETEPAAVVAAIARAEKEG